MSKSFKDWYIVRSEVGRRKDGLPLGEVLCRDIKEAEVALKQAQNGYISEYVNHKEMMAEIEPIKAPIFPKDLINWNLNREKELRGVAFEENEEALKND